MALLGGGVGGAGNPVSGSFTGPAEALEIIGNRGYAFSGLIPASTTIANYIDFTTGNYLFDGWLQMSGTVNPADVGTGTHSVFRLTINDAIVAYYKVSTGGEEMPSSLMNRIIIPPYTKVQIGVVTEQDSAAKTSAIVISGDVVREW